MVNNLPLFDMAPYSTSIAIKTLQAFGDIWLTDKPRYLRSSRCREFKGNLRLRSEERRVGKEC